jgi:rhodanese-related sulfurtransferase
MTDTTPTPDSTALARIGVAAAKRALEAGAAVLVDVRDPGEWRAGHVAGATHIPLAQLPARLDALPRDRALLLFCRSGLRSGVATALLQHHGFARAANVAGGLVAWAGQGLPLVRGV